VTALAVAASLLTGLAACSSGSDNPYELDEIPAPENFCLAAQRLITKTNIPMQLIVHDDFDAFVKSKALIDGAAEGLPTGPVIQQYNWYDDAGDIQGISCKLKNTDHLNIEFGEGSAGPDGLCQDMNRDVFRLVIKKARGLAFKQVTFDKSESDSSTDQPAMNGPDWLAPYTMTYVQDDTLHIATQGFIVNFSDPRFAKAPPRFRGVHYCHLIAPDYLTRLLVGEAEAGAIVGRAVSDGAPPGQQ